jgi:hypothetical protein
MTKQKKASKLTSPAKYRIRIQGYLDNTWGNQLGQMTFTNYLSSQQPLETIIAGFMDQAELLWILTQLYGLGFPLLSVECLDTDE